MEGIKLKKPVKSIKNVKSILVRKGLEMPTPEVKLPSLQATPIRGSSTKRFTFRNSSKGFSEEREQSPTFIVAELNDSVTAADRAFYPEPFTNVALFLHYDSVLRYDLVQRVYEKANLGYLLDSMKPSYCQVNSKRLFICGGSIRETPPTLKKFQVASSSCFSYNWQTHTLVKQRSMPHGKMSHSATLFLNSVFVLGGCRSVLVDNSLTGKAMLKFKLNESIWENYPPSRYPH